MPAAAISAAAGRERHGGTPWPNESQADDSALPLRERKKLSTRRLLADQALTLFSERGSDRVTLDELTTRAETGRSTFFRYYGSKEDVAMAAEGGLWDAYVSRFARHPGQATACCPRSGPRNSWSASPKTDCTPTAGTMYDFASWANSA